MPRPERRRRATQPSAVPGTSTHVHTYTLADLGLQTGNEPVPTFVHRVSEDRRRVYVEELEVEPPSPVKKMRKEYLEPQGASSTENQPEDASFLDPTEFSAFNIHLERYTLFQDDDNDAEDLPRPKTPTTAAAGARPVKPSDLSLHEWRHKRDLYLTAIIRRKGRGAAKTVCPSCKGASDQAPTLRCGECFGDVMYCPPCMVQRHIENPLHILERWTDATFVKTTVSALGHRIQLGHPPHERCAAPEAASKDFVVLHTNGIHEDVQVDFCGCDKALEAGSHEIQILRAGWFPSTHVRPQTAATFAQLEKYHLDSLQSKMSMYDAYGVMEKMTNNTGIKPADRYHEWIRMCREFRHLRLLKRGGRALAYSASGVAGTGAGELAVQCPACPRPGVNLADGTWENASPEERFLYTLFIALDACFRLKRRLVSNELKDPDLGSGWAYMVDTAPYREYLRGVTAQKEMQTCSGLAALDHANTKFSRGYSTTGVVMGVCGRHEFVQANGVGDLQKGERFSNVDYVFASLLLLKDGRLPKTITYDIVCIWAIYLFTRLKELPPHVRLRIIAFICFAIPKLHIHSHTLACQLLFSLNFLLGSAQLDAEGIERAWANIGGVAGSTRDMGPGSRHDTLDCHWSHWNWQKLVDIVKSLRKRLDRANTALAEQTSAFEEFSTQQAEHVPEWRRQVLEWELDSKKPNPFEIKFEGLSEAEVRLQLSKEEAAQVELGVPSLHDVSPSSFISCGLDLEGEQRRVRVQAELKKAQTTEMQIDLVSMRMKLNRGIARFRKLQAVYTPAALQVVSAMNLPETTLAEDVPLVLPSALSVAERATCVKSLDDIEALFRDAQCRCALDRLRNQLHVKSRLYTYKSGHSRHQGSNTRASTIVARNESKIRLHSEKYQMAWNALRRLNEDNGEMVGWRMLRREDIRCMSSIEDLQKKAKSKKARQSKLRKQVAELRQHAQLLPEEDAEMDWDDVNDGDVPENQRLVSWIWTAAGADGTDAGLQKALRVEWCKAYSRLRRWTEEKRLLEEEYRRVGVSFEYEAKKWEARARNVPRALAAVDREGAVAYARRQAAMFRDLKVRGEKTWTEEKLARGKKRPRHVPATAGEADWVDVEEEDQFGGVGERRAGAPFGIACRPCAPPNRSRGGGGRTKSGALPACGGALPRFDLHPVQGAPGRRSASRAAPARPPIGRGAAAGGPNRARYRRAAARCRDSTSTPSRARRAPFGIERRPCAPPNRSRGSAGRTKSGALPARGGALPRFDL
ncbi:hypothetical protein C8R46DRAFT_1043775 [Mycena filopes]|nr:hypothetical protein C8R46DRAFT_1043775 [Mycena filopes]